MKNVSLCPGVQVGLHHVHEVFGGSVSISWHVNQSESFAHSEEVHLLCVTLSEKHEEKQNSEQDIRSDLLSYLTPNTSALMQKTSEGQKHAKHHQSDC